MNIPNDYKEMIKWKRTYRETLIMAFEASVYKVMPNEKIIIGHSLGDGYYFYFENRETINDDEINKISKTLKGYVENDTKIIITPYFKNLSLLQNRLERENKDVLFILDAEMTISLGDNGIKNLAAVNNLALDKIFEDLIKNPSFSSLDVTFEKEGSRCIYILNDDIIVPEGDAFIK